MKEEKNSMAGVELSEEELAEVGGGKKLDLSKKLTVGQSVEPCKKVIIGDGKRGSCKRCGIYSFIDDEGYCYTCVEKRSRGE